MSSEVLLAEEKRTDSPASGRGRPKLRTALRTAAMLESGRTTGASAIQAVGMYHIERTESERSISTTLNVVKFMSVLRLRRAARMAITRDAASTDHMSSIHEAPGTEPGATELTLMSSLKHAVFGSTLNVLLPAIVLGLAAPALGLPPAVTFIANFVAIVPLAQLLGLATEEVAIYSNDIIGGLLNATLGNATELIISIFAIKAGLLRVVQLSLLGSILSNLLLVLGCSFIAGGVKYRTQTYTQKMASINASLLKMAVLGLSVPTAYVTTMRSLCAVPCHVAEVKQISHGTAIVLFLTYGGLLIFSLKTHSYLSNEGPAEKNESYHHHSSASAAPKPASRTVSQGSASAGGTSAAATPTGTAPRPHALSVPTAEEEAQARSQADAIAAAQSSEYEYNGPEGVDEEEEEPSMTFWSAILLLTIATGFIAVCSEFLVDTLEVAAESLHLTELFIGLILLPIIGNAAEHATAVVMAYKGKTDLALGVALGSSIQIALGAIPALILVAWAMDVPLTLDLGAFEVIILLMSTLVAASTLDYHATYLDGLMLVGAYIIIAIAYFYKKEVLPTSRAACMCGTDCCNFAG